MRILVKENTAEPVQYYTKFFAGPTVYGKQIGYNEVTSPPPPHAHAGGFLL